MTLQKEPLPQKKKKKINLTMAHRPEAVHGSKTGTRECFMTVPFIFTSEYAIRKSPWRDWD